MNSYIHKLVQRNKSHQEWLLRSTHQVRNQEGPTNGSTSGECVRVLQAPSSLLVFSFFQRLSFLAQIGDGMMMPL